MFSYINKNINLLFRFQYKLFGDSSNDSVTGEVYLHKNEDTPHVIFVHGWRMDSNERVKKNISRPYEQLELEYVLFHSTLSF